MQSTPRRATARWNSFSSRAIKTPGICHCCSFGEVTSGDIAEDLGLLHEQDILIVDLHLGARPFAEQDAVARLHIERDELAGFVASTRTDGDNFALLRLLLCSTGMMMPPFVFSSVSIRRMTTLTWSGRNDI